jgi:hypothetical protein
MVYQFYPRKDAPCPNVGHCPHVGGSAIASLVATGNENQLYLRQLHGTIDAEKERNRRLLEENEKLSMELEQAGKDEILLSRIGPLLRSKAIYLRNVIGFEVMLAANPSTT